MYYTVQEPQTLEEIVFKHYGNSMKYLEMVLLANPHLANLNVFLDVGTVIFLPVTEAKPSQRAKLL